jgi:hypothetical protein
MATRLTQVGMAAVVALASASLEATVHQVEPAVVEIFTTSYAPPRDRAGQQSSRIASPGRTVPDCTTDA